MAVGILWAMRKTVVAASEIAPKKEVESQSRDASEEARVSMEVVT